jgi:hypothetical protein
MPFRNQLCQKLQQMPWGNLAVWMVLVLSEAALPPLGLGADARSYNHSKLLLLPHQTPESAVTKVTVNHRGSAIALENTAGISQEQSSRNNTDGSTSFLESAELEFNSLAASSSSAQQPLPPDNLEGTIENQSFPGEINPRVLATGKAADLLLESGENEESIESDRALEKQQPDSNPQSPPTQGGSNPPPTEEDPELGRLLLRQQEVPPPAAPQVKPTPPPAPPPAPQTRREPILHLLPRISYFQTNNVFSGIDPIDDSLIFSSLTLWSAPRLGENTYLNASADGNLIRYINQSEFNYNLLRFRVGVSQRLNRQMWGEIGWSNQQFYRTDGDRFLNEQIAYLSLSRQDRLTQKLIFNSYYDLRVSVADPDTRSRVINSLYLSLSYYFRPNLQVGLDYQFERADFTQQDREDMYHRIMGRFTYGVLRDSQINLLGGVTVGGSSEPFIDFDSLFFSVTYSVDFSIF